SIKLLHGSVQLALAIFVNNLVSGYFDFAEISAIEHRPMYMSDYIRQLDTILTSGGRPLLSGSGTISHENALKKANEEYRKFQQKTPSPVEQAYLDTIQSIENEVKKTQKHK
ncbi:MAG: virulence RhuM family protein, partial [Oscillospiraceae bacterium]|nr:virulence RhuM family protein [Oscillospiraceae bacterium]